MQEIKPNTYWLTRIVFLRAVAFIYFVAFVVAYNQNKALIGDRGLLPLKLYMESVKSRVGDSWWMKISACPTLLWFNEPWVDVNAWLDNIALAGATISALVIISGSANIIIMISLWVLYHSIVNVGQQWYSFGWESQLLETGFLGIWGVALFSLSSLPKNCPTPWVMIGGLKWLIVRIMLGAGLIKVRGDKCWMDLTCMNYHYETQPVPNPASYYLHQSPEWIHMGETLGNHIVELVIPFFAFLPRGYGIVCGIIQISFQVILIISGNLSFLNWLTIVPSIAFFDDKCLSIFFTKKTKDKIVGLQSKVVEEATTRKVWNMVMAIFIGYLSLPVVINLISSRQMMNISYEPFRIVNTYGAFGSVTKIRHEVILEGTTSLNPYSEKNATWFEYTYKCKPGDVNKTPCFISPYHYRLDWLMWFAAFQSYEQNVWLIHLIGKLLVNEEEAFSLIDSNPFLEKEPPKFIRAELYKYEYTKLDSEEARNGQWYKRKHVKQYFPPANVEILKKLFRRIGWTTLDHVP